MRRLKLKTGMLLILSAVLFLTGCTSGEKKSQDTDTRTKTAQRQKAWKKAETSPWGKYPETVTYTLGQMKGTGNSNLPEGETYENNAYTRYLKKILNVQNKNIFMESEEGYDEALNILVKDRNLPDIFLVSDRETLEELVENDLIEDLTDVYKSCASDRIREMYEGYGDELLESGTFDGKLLALPETAIDHGPQLLWLRRDWIEQLGLTEPETLEDAFSVIQAFQENRMGAEGDEEPVGLVCDPGLVGTVSTSYSMDAIFENFGAYFGLWWTPNNPLMDEYRQNKDADWQPYYLTSGARRQVEVYSTFRDNKYVVVRKGYEHPEIVMKVLSVLFDYSRYEADDTEEMNAYFALNVDPTARPLMINVDYNEATYMVTRHIREALYGSRMREELSAIEASYFDACKKYLGTDSPSVEEWAAYKSRITAVGLLVDASYHPPERKYMGDGDSEIPQTLQQLEKKAFIQIIMGKKPLSYFDTFVKEWYRKGGEALTESVCSGKMSGTD